MLKKIEVENVQRHANTTLEFSEGLNVIIGSSDAGKTTIKRALEWLTFNKIAPTNLVRKKQNQMSVKGFFEDEDGDFTIKRLWNKKENAYTLISENDPKKNTEEAAVGRGTVPSVIQTALRMNDLNFQSQMDKPLLFDDSPGAVAKFLNKIVHFDVIDRTLKYLNAKKRKNQSEAKVYAELVEETREKLKSFASLENVEPLIEKIEIEYAGIVNSQNKLSSLATLEQKIIQCKEELSIYNTIENEKVLVETALDILKKLKTKEEKLNRLTELQDNLLKTQKDIQENTITDEEKKTVEISLSLLNKRKDGQKKLKILTDLELQLQKTQNKIKQSSEKRKQLEIEFAAKMPDICPLCGQATEGVI